MTRCGFFAVMGPPNAGKSTLVNALVGQKISIVTPKAQTTRARVLGVMIVGQAQLALIDTPGIFAPRGRLETAMTRAAWDGAAEADMALLVVDVSRAKAMDAAEMVARDLKGRPALLALNQIDRVKRDSLLAAAARFNAVADFTETVMISAETGDGLDRLRRLLAAHAPAGPWHFPEDQTGDQPLRRFAAEITREKLFLGLRQELPYQLTVETEAWENFDDGSVKITQVILIARDNHKGIVLGKGGANIKRVREAARAELAQELDQPVHLFLRVKVRPNWMDDPERYREMGLDWG